MFVLNILLLGIKVILIFVEFGYKNSKLGEAPTSLDKNDEKGGDMELGTAESTNEDQIIYHHNPMMDESRSEDTVPLLRRVDNVEHETKSVKAKTESIEAKTDRMEEKFKLALEEMNKKMEKIVNPGNSL